MPAQLQPDPKRSVSHHLRLEQIHPELKWEKVHFGDGPPAFSGHVWAEKADSCPHGKPFYLDGLCFFDNSTTPSSTARRRNTPMLMSSIDCLSVMIPISTETKERKESSQDPALTKVMRFTREGWHEKRYGDDPPEKFRKIADSVFFMAVYWYGARVVIPTKLRRQVLDLLHECHFGIQRMKQLARTAVYWPNIDSYILDLCWQCPICAGHQSEPSKAVSTRRWYLRNRGAACILIMPRFFFKVSLW